MPESPACPRKHSDLSLGGSDSPIPTPHPGVVYVQYTNPGSLPPIQQSAGIFASQGWPVHFLGIHLEGDAGRLEMSELPGIQVERLRSFGSGWRLKVHYFVFLLWCWYKILRVGPALLYVSDPIATPAGAFLSLVTSVPIVYHEHDSPFDVPRGRTEKWLIRSRNFLARRARMCVLPNDQRAEAFARTVAGSAPVWHVMNCSSRRDIGKWPGKGNQHRGLAVYYHGSIVPERVPIAVLDALALLPACVRLTVVGAETNGYPGYLAYLKDEAFHRGLQSRVRFEGLVTPRETLLGICSEHDIGLALMPKETRDPNLRWMAGASVKIFDYLACGLAVLVSDLPDHERLFVAGGVARSCDPGLPESIASNLSWFVEHAEETCQMGERGRRRVQEDWNYERQFQPVLDAVALK